MKMIFFCVKTYLNFRYVRVVLTTKMRAIFVKILDICTNFKKFYVLIFTFLTKFMILYILTFTTISKKRYILLNFSFTIALRVNSSSPYFWMTCSDCLSLHFSTSPVTLALHDRVRYYWGRVSNFNQSEAIKHCFLASDWLRFVTLPRKYRIISLILTPSTLRNFPVVRSTIWHVELSPDIVLDISKTNKLSFSKISSVWHLHLQQYSLVLLVFREL